MRNVWSPFCCRAFMVLCTLVTTVLQGKAEVLVIRFVVETPVDIVGFMMFTNAVGSVSLTFLPEFWLHLWIPRNTACW